MVSTELSNRNIGHAYRRPNKTGKVTITQTNVLTRRTDTNENVCVTNSMQHYGYQRPLFPFYLKSDSQLRSIQYGNKCLSNITQLREVILMNVVYITEPIPCLLTHRYELVVEHRSLLSFPTFVGANISWNRPPMTSQVKVPYCDNSVGSVHFKLHLDILNLTLNI
jgi:hypothetical protein